MGSSSSQKVCVFVQVIALQTSTMLVQMLCSSCTLFNLFSIVKSKRWTLLQSQGKCVFSLQSFALKNRDHYKMYKNKQTTKNYYVLDIVSSSLSSSIAMGRWLLLGLLLFSQSLLQAHTLPGIVLPMQKLLLVDELGTLGVDQLLPEVFILQQLQHVQAVRVSAGKGTEESHFLSQLTDS